jgi:hypothetical protein
MLFFYLFLELPSIHFPKSSPNKILYAFLVSSILAICSSHKVPPSVVFQTYFMFLRINNSDIHTSIPQTANHSGHTT